jgi:hypothetical protein
VRVTQGPLPTRGQRPDPDAGYDPSIPVDSSGAGCSIILAGWLGVLLICVGIALVHT